MKILGSDYDGTLYQGGVSEENRARVAEWQAHGHKFGIVSGRGVDFPPKLARIYPEMKMDFFVLCNGAYIIDGEGNEIFRAGCREVSARAVVSDLLLWGCDFVHVSADTYRCILTSPEKNPGWVQETSVSLLEDFADIESFCQLSVMLGTSEEATELVGTVRQKYGAWVNPLQNGRCIDIVPKGVNKATGMARVIAHYGAMAEDACVVGDNMNDMDMIRAVRSYAMASGVEALKAVATFVVDSVAELIEREI